MKVLHVLDVSAPTISGYTSRSRDIVNTQRALGLDAVVLTSPRHDNPDRRAREEIDGIRHYRTPWPSSAKRRPIPEVVEMFRFCRRIIEVARRERPDLIHGHSSILCGIPSYVAARLLGLPCVYEIRAFWEDGGVSSGKFKERSLAYRAIRRAETSLARRVDALICLCEGVKGEMARRGLPARDLYIVPNGVDTDRFTPLQPEERARARYGLGGKKVVAYVGTFLPFEGVDYLVRALIKLIKDCGRDDIRGLIVGQGPTYEQCRAVAAAAGLGDKILHPGPVPHAEVNALYSIADMLVYPRAGHRVAELVTPLKPLEAMAMEKPVIGSDVGGLRELIQDEVTGLIHRREDIDDLAAKITRLIDDEALRRRLGRTAREWVVENRQWRTLVERHLEIYDRAQRKSSRRGALQPWRAGHSRSSEEVWRRMHSRPPSAR